MKPASTSALSLLVESVRRFLGTSLQSPSMPAALGSGDAGIPEHRTSLPRMRIPL